MSKKQNPKNDPPIDGEGQDKEIEANQDPNKQQESQGFPIYDSVLRFLADELVEEWIAPSLNLEIHSFEHIPEKQIEIVVREADYFYFIEASDSTENQPKKLQKQILHIEFQTKKDYKMIYRMAEYHGIMLKKHQLPIRHVVVYLGTNKINMDSQLDPTEVFTGFNLINLWELDINHFLNSDAPGVAVLGILSNYPHEQLGTVLRYLIKHLRVISPNDTSYAQYVAKLGLLARLREKNKQDNLIITKILEDMSMLYDITKDGLYQKGLSTGIVLTEERMLKQLEAERKKAEAERKKVEVKLKAERKKAEAERKKVEAELKAERKKTEAKLKVERKKAEAKHKKAQTEMIKYLLVSSKLTNREIAKIADVEEEFVKQLRKDVE